MKHVANLRVREFAPDTFALLWEEDSEPCSAIIESHVAQALIKAENGIPYEKASD